MVEKLTLDQLLFLNHHQIPLRAVFDATGLTKKEYLKLMKDTGTFVAIGTTQCRKGNHTMRLSGSCLQCNPLALVHYFRHYNNATVYVAGSMSRQILKIGYTNDIVEREKTLISSRYGGISDWKIIYSFNCKQAGRMESEIHHKLADYYCPSTYAKGGRQMTSYELFNCGIKKVKAAIAEIKEERKEQLFGEQELQEAETTYDFPNIIQNTVRKGSETKLPDSKESEMSVNAERKSEIDFERLSNNIEFSNSSIEFIDLSWMSKIKLILTEVGRELNAGEIVSRVIEKGSKQPKEKTRSSIASLLTRRLKRHFYREGKNYGLMEWKQKNL